MDTNALLGWRVLLTAGPTQEALDPVRYISNHSTGKMGYALAEALAKAGAQVTLVSGPTHLQVAHPGIQRVDVTSAAQMLEACLAHHPAAHLTVLAAAVADYTPREPAARKIKKDGHTLLLELVKTADIAAELGRRKANGQRHVGFALETDNELANARAKLERKNLDMIVLNSLQDAGAGFGHDTNQVTLLWPGGAELALPLMAKTELAVRLVKEMAALLP